jgi:2-methylcitrate dehydratase PrpD
MARSRPPNRFAKQIGDRAIKRVVVKVYPNAKMLAGREMPKTPLECKFSLAFCVALGLRGYHAVPSDFSMERLAEPLVSAIIPVVEVLVVPDQPQFQGNIDVWLEDGEHLKGSTQTVLGNPDNPMSWDDTYVKFSSLVEPILGEEKMNALFTTLKTFEKPGSLVRAMGLVAEDTHHGGNLVK